MRLISFIALLLLAIPPTMPTPPKQSFLAENYEIVPFPTFPSRGSRFAGISASNELLLLGNASSTGRIIYLWSPGSDLKEITYSNTTYVDPVMSPNGTVAGVYDKSGSNERGFYLYASEEGYQDLGLPSTWKAKAGSRSIEWDRYELSPLAVNDAQQILIVLFPKDIPKNKGIYWNTYVTNEYGAMSRKTTWDYAIYSNGTYLAIDRNKFHGEPEGGKAWGLMDNGDILATRELPWKGDWVVLFNPESGSLAELFKITNSTDDIYISSKGQNGPILAVEPGEHGILWDPHSGATPYQGPIPGLFYKNDITSKGAIGSPSEGSIWYQGQTESLDQYQITGVLGINDNGYIVAYQRGKDVVMIPK